MSEGAYPSLATASNQTTRFKPSIASFTQACGIVPWTFIADESSGNFPVLIPALR